jgi:hypothetical protein
MNKGIKEYSQWFPGEENVIADALSRDDDRDDTELTKILQTFCPSQLPQDFKIVPLPSEISSWLTSVLQKLPVQTQLQEKHTRTKIGRGTDGTHTHTQSESVQISSWIHSQDHKESNSWVPSPWLCVKGAFREQIMRPWLRAQSEIPFRLWHRPSGRTTESTPPSITMASLDEFYQDNTVPSETKTHL